VKEKNQFLKMIHLKMHL